MIGSDCLTQEEVIKTNACVKALTYCDLQYISLKGLREVLCLYPDYAQKFITEIRNDLTYNLREGHNTEVQQLPNITTLPLLSSSNFTNGKNVNKGKSESNTENEQR